MRIEAKSEGGQHLSDEDLLSIAASQPRSHEILLQHAAKVARLGYFVFDVDTSIVRVCSERHAEIFGLTPDEFIDKASGLKGEMAMMHPDDADMVRNAYDCLRRGEDIAMAYRFRRADGSEGWVREFVVPQRDKTGRIVQGLGSSLDVTEARADQQRAQEAHRLEALGGLTAGVAHDFNNLLSVVMGNAELIRATTDDAEVQNFVDDIVSAAKRGARLTGSLLSFAQLSRMEPKILDINEEIGNCVRAFDRFSQKSVSIVTRLAPGRMPVRLDADGFQQTVLNLLMNACDASEPGSTITVRTFRSAPSVSPRESVPGGCIVEIEDQGCGIAPENLPRVCEPYFTTKGRARGSGLGLSMAQGFVGQSGGALEIASAPGEGTRATMRFPEHKDDQTPVPAPDEEDGGELEHLHVLLLEDDEQVGRIACRTLEAAGASVTWLRDASEAERAVTGTQRFDVAVLDRVVPGPRSGTDIARMIRDHHPGTPVILVSGLPESAEPDTGVFDKVLTKPVKAGQLVASIRKAASANPG